MSELAAATVGIRLALPLDARAIAEVHTRSWQWAFVGATALGTWPQYRWQISALWVAWPLLLILAAHVLRVVV